MTPLPKGYVHIYTGDGKGKTTAALGLALRAAGAGLKVLIIQFMKGQEYSETKALKRFSPEIGFIQTGRRKCIRKEEVSDEDRREAHRGLDLARQAMLKGEIDLLILDEILVAHWFELVSLDEILSLLDARPRCLELVLTGRRAPQELIKKADLVTEMRAIKHYYEIGVPARKGIES